MCPPMSQRRGRLVFKVFSRSSPASGVRPVFGCLVLFAKSKGRPRVSAFSRLTAGPLLRLVVPLPRLARVVVPVRGAAALRVPAAGSAGAGAAPLAVSRLRIRLRAGWRGEQKDTPPPPELPTLVVRRFAGTCAARDATSGLSRPVRPMDTQEPSASRI